MAALNNTQTLPLQLEKTRKKIPLLYERDNILLNRIQKRDVEKLSNRALRLPLQIRPGGRPGHADFAGGDLGRGTGTTYEVATVSPIGQKHAVEIQKIAEYATNSDEKAVANAVKREVVNGMAQFKSYLDKLMQTAGGGQLATIASGFGTTTWVLTGPVGAQLLIFDQIISDYNSTLATNNGTATITSIDYPNKTITVNAAPVGNANGDILLPDGVSGATPTSLFGIKYHQSNANTGTWMNLNRATYPEIRTPRVNAASAALTTGPVRLALNLVRLALGIDSLKEVVVYTHPAQEHAWEQLGVQISQIIKNSTGGDDVDLLFTGKKTMAGYPLVTSINADPSRIDMLDLSHWGRAEMKEIDLYEVDGNTSFPIYGTTGGIAAAQIFYFVTSFQVWTDSPRSGSFIDNLAIPTGY